MNSEKIRNNERFLRNAYEVTEGIGMPIIAKNKNPFPPIDKMLSYHDTRLHDNRAETQSLLVHFFKDDYRFEHLYYEKNEKRDFDRIKKLAQYSAVCTPDFSVYPEMSLPLQRMQVFKNRWCGAHWQDKGLLVVPTVTWADQRSFEFCFDGLPQHAILAVSTVGCKKYPVPFLRGYTKMLEVLQPEIIFCYGDRLPEMEGNVQSFAYKAFTKKEAM